MRLPAAVPLVAVLGTAFVLPDGHVLKELAPGHGRSAEQAPASRGEDGFGLLHSRIVKPAICKASSDDGSEIASWPPHHHGPPNLTIYELITRSKHTTKFAKLVDEHQHMVNILNSTSANYTLFVPTDEAFEHIPEDHKPSKDFVEALLKYHVALGSHSIHSLLATGTLPTALSEPLLDGHPQRLSISPHLLGIRVNHYSRVVASDIHAGNGVVHAVSHLLVPPPVVGKELALLPAQFSTLLLAYQKTGLVGEIHRQYWLGATLFAPDNRAWERLGLRANAFLFNTPAGVKYLHALLQYQLTPNATLYSDAFYEVEGRLEGQGVIDRRHVDLPTLLDDAAVSVDITRVAGLAHIVVNKNVLVTLRDAVAKNGVIHVVHRVPIPPRKHHRGAWGQADGEIEVEDLKEMLKDYVVDDDDDDGDDEHEAVDLVADDL